MRPEIGGGASCRVERDYQPANRARQASGMLVEPRRPLDGIVPTWRVGDQVRWQGRVGTFRRDVGDGEHAEVAIGERVYRVRTSELG